MRRDKAARVRPTHAELALHVTLAVCVRVFATRGKVRCLG